MEEILELELELETEETEETEEALTPQEMLEEELSALQEEKEKLLQELDGLQKRKAIEEDRIKKEKDFLDQKMAILKGGFEQLEMDKKRLEKEKNRFEAERDVVRNMTEKMMYSDTAKVFFKGVSNPLTLKKRYKDLIKIFHPDNVCGDTDTIQSINIEYERLRQEFSFRRAGSE